MAWPRLRHWRRRTGLARHRTGNVRTSHGHRHHPEQWPTPVLSPTTRTRAWEYGRAARLENRHPRPRRLRPRPRLDHQRAPLPHKNHLPPQDLPDWISTALTTTREPTTRTSCRDIKHHDGYALAALTSELDTLLAAAEGHRNDALNRAAFVFGQLTATGLLDPSIVHDELVSAAGRIGLTRREAQRTIASGFSAGTRQPRQHLHRR